MKKEGPMKIYIVEDEITIRSELAKLLESYGYTCAYSDDFQNIVEHILKEATDLILLDINLPFYDGYHVCREIRKQTDTPIIIVTSRNNDMDELMSMNLGADDYVIKPFRMRELLARIQAVLRRTGNAADTFELLREGNIVLDERTHTVSVRDEPAQLTPIEFDLLATLMRSPGRVFTRSELVDQLSDSGFAGLDSTLNVHIRNLRLKIEAQPGQPEYVETVFGIGYRFKRQA